MSTRNEWHRAAYESATSIAGKSSDDSPIFSRCAAGKDRWFWVVFASLGDWCNGLHAKACGYEPTAEGAEVKAREVAGPGGRPHYATMASHYRRRLLVEARMNRPSSGAKDSARLEFLYCVDTGYDDYDGSRYVSVEKHRIVKKTARRIYIEREPFQEHRWERMTEEYRSSWYAYDVRTMVIDLATLEREGKHRHPEGGWWRGDFYATEEDGRRDQGTSVAPVWCDLLGLVLPCSTDEIKTAYRQRVKDVHPDAGGDATAFVAIERAYREALAYCGNGVAGGVC